MPMHQDLTAVQMYDVLRLSSVRSNPRQRSPRSRMLPPRFPSARNSFHCDPPAAEVVHPGARRMLRPVSPSLEHAHKYGRIVLSPQWLAPWRNRVHRSEDTRGHIVMVFDVCPTAMGTPWPLSCTCPRKCPAHQLHLKNN